MRNTASGVDRQLEKSLSYALLTSATSAERGFVCENYIAILTNCNTLNLLPKTPVAVSCAYEKRFEGKPLHVELIAIRSFLLIMHALTASIGQFWTKRYDPI